VSVYKFKYKFLDVNFRDKYLSIAVQRVRIGEQKRPVEKVENDESTWDANVAEGLEDVDSLFGGIFPAVRTLGATTETIQRHVCRRRAVHWFSRKLQKHQLIKFS